MALSRNFSLSLLLVVVAISINTSCDAFVPNEYRRYTLVSSFSATALQSKKKTTTSTANKKIQVKLLKHVAGTGQAGEVVQVTPAFFNNKLLPTKSAQLITDDQVELEQKKARDRQNEIIKKANELKMQIDELNLEIVRKAGPDGQLFGSIGPKVVMEELKQKISDDFLDEKFVRISHLMASDGNKISGDIKHIGDFSASISLTTDITATFKIQVLPEK